MRHDQTAQAVVEPSDTRRPVQADLAAAGPILDRLLAKLGAFVPLHVVTDPVIVAAEAAVGAHCLRTGGMPVGEAALRLMPPSATSFERGLAVGMALVLATRSDEG